MSTTTFARDKISPALALDLPASANHRIIIRDTWECERKDFRKRIGTGQAIALSGNAVLDMTGSTLENYASRRRRA